MTVAIFQPSLAQRLLRYRHILTPVDITETINNGEIVYSSAAIEIDSVAVGNGIVIVNGTWRLL